MTYRNGPNSYDCSSAVFYGLRAAGKPIPHVGNTETLFSMEGGILKRINRSQIQAGDIFVSGRKGSSGNAAGHAGFALNATQAIHCSSRFNGIGVSSNSDATVAAYSGAPVVWYRVVGASTPTTPTPTPAPETPKIYINTVNNDKEYYINKDLQAIVGIRIKTVSFSDVASPADLLLKAKDWIEDQPLDLQALTINYAQLDKLSRGRYKKLKEYDVVNVIIDPLNINIRMRIDKKSFRLDDDGTGELLMGRRAESMTDLLIDR